MRTRTIGLGLLTCVAVSCLAAAFSGTAQARDQTFTPFTEASFPWLVKAMSATRAESFQLAKHWHTNTAFWDFGGVPVYIGAPRQLDRLGQRAYEQALQKVCAYGTHQYTPEHPTTLGGITTWSRIVVLTAGSWSCINHGKYHTLSTKVVEATLAHEVLEYLVDPKDPVDIRKINHHNVEVCDPVNTKYAYDQQDGAWITDFVYPSYFEEGSFPVDYFGELTKGI
jgi:hypothetical protein